MKTFEYEIRRAADAKTERDESVLLPKDGEVFPRMLATNEQDVREEAMRKHHDVLADIPSREVIVNARPFC